MHRSVLLSLVVLGALLVAGVTSAQNFGSSPIEQFFRFEWEIVRSGGGPVMKGYIYNSNGYRATSVRVLAGVDGA